MSAARGASRSWTFWLDDERFVASGRAASGLPDELRDFVVVVERSSPKTVSEPLLTSSVIRSKYINKLKKTSYVVGQYLWIRLR